MLILNHMDTIELQLLCELLMDIRLKRGYCILIEKLCIWSRYCYKHFSFILLWRWNRTFLTQKMTRNLKMYEWRELWQNELWIKFFGKKSKFDHEIVVSDNDNIHFWILWAFLLMKRLLRHTKPLSRVERNFSHIWHPTNLTRLLFLKSDNSGVV